MSDRWFRRCDPLADPVSGQRLVALCDGTWEPGRPAPPSGVVYCKTEHAGALFEAVRGGERRYVLLTHNSDRRVEQDAQAGRPPQIAHWFAMNCRVSAPDVTAVPIGLVNHQWACGNLATWRQARAVPREPAQKPLYCCFSVETNPRVRRPIWERFSGSAAAGWVTVRGGRHHTDVPPDEYAADLRRHPFVLSPPGNGPDCHRIWEALYSGAVPVVLRGPALDPFCDGRLPILALDDYDELTEGLLRGLIETGRYERDDWDLSALTLGHWKRRFEEARHAID